MLYEINTKDNLLYIKNVDEGKDMALQRVLYDYDFESLFIAKNLDLATLQDLERKVFNFVEYYEFPKIGGIKLYENFIKAVCIEEDMISIRDEIFRYLKEKYESKVTITRHKIDDWIMYGIIKCGEQYNVQNVIDHVKGLINALYELSTFIKYSIKDLENINKSGSKVIFIPTWWNRCYGPAIFIAD